MNLSVMTLKIRSMVLLEKKLIANRKIGCKKERKPKEKLFKRVL